MRFHVVGLPHTQTTKEYVNCAFTEKVRRFCLMMKDLGHEVYLYAGEENEAPCDELITCISGSIEDYFIDLRPESKTFGKYGSVTLSGLDGKSVLIPPGIGHAYQSIQNDTIVSYLLNDSYSTEFESSIRPVGDGSPIVFSMEPTEISIRDLNSITFSDFLSNL